MTTRFGLRITPEIGTLPAGWKFTSFWQYADSGPNPGDADLWNGSYDNLKKYVFSSQFGTAYLLTL